jgi:hypothetical protein
MNRTAANSHDTTARSLIVIVIVVTASVEYSICRRGFVVFVVERCEILWIAQRQWKKAGRAIPFKMSDSVLARAGSFDVLRVTLYKPAGWAKQMSVVNSVNGVSHRCEITAWTKNQKIHHGENDLIGFERKGGERGSMQTFSWHTDERESERKRERGRLLLALD